MDACCKILVIDDEEIVRDSCTEILEGSEYRVETAPNGTRGLEIAETFHPDLVFVDLKMPGMTGLEVIERFQALDPTIVTVVITGFATISSAVEAMKLGAYDFLPKPFTPDEFRLITKRGLEKRQLVLETIALRREKEMLKENFAAIVSHELKSPLGAVQQNLFVLSSELSGTLSADQEQRLERMKSRISDLVDLINTWLRVISVDIDSIKEHFEPTSIYLVISKAAESAQPHATRKAIEIVTSFEDPESCVYGEKVTLTEVLVNLSNNAVKYSYPGSKVLIEAKDEDDRVAISVTDTGVGIPTQDLPYIFDDFFSGRPDQEGKRGYGLGLAISKRIIEVHNGSISVESEIGKGSTFVIRLPRFKPVLQPESLLQPDVRANS